MGDVRDMVRLHFMLGWRHGEVFRLIHAVDDM